MYPPNLGNNKADLRLLPKGSIRTLIISSALAIALLGLYLYADNAFPHGPSVFTGQYEERCRDDRGPCAEVPVYREDTSGLNNPGWVTWVRDLYIMEDLNLVVGIGVVAGIVAAVQASGIWKAWKEMDHDAAVLNYLDEKLGEGKTELWREKATYLIRFKRYEEAIEATEMWVQHEIRGLRADWPRDSKGNVDKDSEDFIRKEGERDIAYIREKMNEDK